MSIEERNFAPRSEIDSIYYYTPSSCPHSQDNSKLPVVNLTPGIIAKFLSSILTSLCPNSGTIEKECPFSYQITIWSYRILWHH